MDINYWISFYNDKRGRRTHSLFAQYVYKYFLQFKRNSILDLGCGNCVDSLFFARLGFEVYAIDQCIPKELLSVHHPNLKIEETDFCHFSFDTHRFDNVYSRFSLHSINKEQECLLVDKIYNTLNNKGLLFIEVRGLKNELYKKGYPVKGDFNAFIYEGHYRRFIDSTVLSKQLIEKGFEIIYSSEKKGFAPYKGENQTFIRIVARKNDKCI